MDGQANQSSPFLIEDISQSNPPLVESSQSDSSMSHNGHQPNETSGFYASFREMQGADIPEAKEIIFGTGRGEIAMLVSVTNVGKSTLALNMALCLAAGEPHPVLAPHISEPCRVLYCDFEASRSMLRGYVQKMLSNNKKMDLAIDNLVMVVDAVLVNLPLNLSNERHRQRLTQHAMEHKVDLIIIDTVGAAFSLKDENSNAEVTNGVLLPMKNLARKANAAILLCHHVGKTADFQRSIQAYAGRGASAWGAIPRAVFLLKRDNQSGEDYPVLECAKAKRSKFTQQQLKLNRATAWFEVLSQAPITKDAVTYDEVIQFIRENELAPLKLIQGNFEGRRRSSPKSISRLLDAAIAKGDIERITKGVYSFKKR